MAQQKLTCVRCRRERYESRMQRVRAYGVQITMCSAKTQCQVAARKGRKP